MAAINRPFTGYGFFTGPGPTGITRVNYSWAAIGSGPTDTNPLVLEHGSITATESAQITTIGTTAFNGWSDSYAGPTTITGTINGYLAASNTDHATDPVSVRAGTKGFLILTAGTWTYSGWMLISSFDISVDAGDFAAVSVGFTMKAAPTARRLGFYQGGGCVRP